MTATSTHENKWIRIRLLCVAGVMATLMLAIGYKAFNTATVKHDRLAALGRAQYTKAMELPGARGTITDRNGVELAVSVNVDSVAANPRAVRDLTGAAAKLAGILEIDARVLEHKLGQRNYFVWIKRRVSPKEADAIRAADIHGVYLTAEPRRFYPMRELAGPTLGFSNIDGKGIEGLELTMDHALRGKDHKVKAIRDARGNLVLSEGTEVNAHQGATVRLTLDRSLQYIADQALAKAVKGAKAKSGVAIVLKPTGGDILALANYPTYDPNRPGDKEDAKNRVLTDAYEPGSVMKAFVMAAALEKGVVRPGQRIDPEKGRMKVGRKMIRDVHREDHPITLTEIIKYSSNVGAVKVAQKVGAPDLRAAYAKFGFGKRTGINLPGERSGLLLPAKRWGQIGLATHAYGYGLSATPLQLAAAMASLANGGQLYAPRIVDAVITPEGKVKPAEAETPTRVLSRKNANLVAKMLGAVFEEGGTGEDLRLRGFSAAGKTGTIHKVNPETKRYFSDRYMSSFAGFVPAEDPRLIIVVIIDDPRGKHYYGGKVAGPVFATIASEGLKVLGVAPTEPLEPDENAPGDTNATPLEEDIEAIELANAQISAELAGALPPAGPEENIVIIPNFSGMTIREALDAARAAGVAIEISGSGKCSKQFPGPGRAQRSVVANLTFTP